MGCFSSLRLRFSVFGKTIVPIFKGSKMDYSSFRNGAECYLTIYYKNHIIRYIYEINIYIEIDTFNVMDSPSLSSDSKKALFSLFSSKKPMNVIMKESALIIKESLFKEAI